MINCSHLCNIGPTKVRMRHTSLHKWAFSSVSPYTFANTFKRDAFFLLQDLIFTAPVYQ